jgi:hypothetical protein
MLFCRGGVDCKRIWQIGMEHASTEEDEDFDTESMAGSVPPATICSSGGMCRWLRDDNSVPLKPGTTGLWVNVFSEAGRSGQVGTALEFLQYIFAPIQICLLVHSTV